MCHVCHVCRVLCALPSFLTRMGAYAVCVCVAAFCRELAEPLIPTVLYRRCYDCIDSVEDSVALLSEVPDLSRRVLRYIVRCALCPLSSSVPFRIPSRQQP
jgi:hypothetical protein